MNILRTENGLISFDDCPNKCKDGKIFDPFKKTGSKWKPCPYCAEKRKEYASSDLKDAKTGKTLSETLNLPRSYTGNEFNEDLVLPAFARKQLKPDTVDGVLTKLRQLMTDISIGSLPEESLMFNLGIKSNEVNFVYPYLVKGYINNLKVSPLINPIDLCRARLEYEGSISDDSVGYSYRDLVESDVCVVVIDAGAVRSSILGVKGLMQLRAQKLKPTIIFTNKWDKYITDMCSEDGYSSYNLATLYTVEYKDNIRLATNSDYYTPRGEGYGVSHDEFQEMLRPKMNL